jgi:ABC-type antimicrobial peptide transport system permease subunit
MRLAVLGTALGLAGAVAMTRFMENLLFGVRPGNVPTFLAVAVVLGLVTLTAAYIPTRRALGVNPASSLQAE